MKLTSPGWVIVLCLTTLFFLNVPSFSGLLRQYHLTNAIGTSSYMKDIILACVFCCKVCHGINGSNEYPFVF